MCVEKDPVTGLQCTEDKPNHPFHLAAVWDPAKAQFEYSEPWVNTEFIPAPQVPKRGGIPKSQILADINKLRESMKEPGPGTSEHQEQVRRGKQSIKDSVYEATPAAWKEYSARVVLRLVARQQRFSSIDFWNEVDSEDHGLGESPDRRFLGPLLAAMAKQGLIKRTESMRRIPGMSHWRHDWAGIEYDEAADLGSRRHKILLSSNSTTMRVVDQVLGDDGEMIAESDHDRVVILCPQCATHAAVVCSSPRAGVPAWVEADVTMGV